MYLKYGGKNLKDIDKKDLADNVSNYIFLVLIMNIIVLFIGLLIKSFILCAFSFGMLSYNLLGYFKSFYQSIGEFKLYGLSLNIEKVGIFLGNLLLLFVFKSDNYKYYIILQVLIGLIISIVLYIFLVSKIKIWRLGRISLRVLKENILSGFILMLGNFTSSFFTGIDRWFIKLLMTAQSFAVYAFAVSIENIMNVFISPITISLYNYLCRIKEQETIKKIKKYILLWITLIISVAFPIKFILERFLTKYVEATSIIFILFTAQVFYSIINGIYVNLYKVEKKQKYYMNQMVLMLIFAIILNMILYKLFGTIQFIAIATLITAFTWFMICEVKYKNIRFRIKEYIYILFILLAYFICGYRLNAILGCISYIIIYITLTMILLKESVLELFGYLKNYIYTKFKKSKV